VPKSKVPKTDTNYRAISKDKSATRETLDQFQLTDLANLTAAGHYNPGASSDFHLYFVGKDNVHEIIVYLLSRCRKSLYLNMFGYDDAELNSIIMDKCKDPNMEVFITLDSSQSGTKTEKALLELDAKEDLKAMNTKFVIGKSSTGQITHTKGFVADAKVGAEGSTNWSKSGQGVGTPGTKGYVAQNNTQTAFINPDAVMSFQNELAYEHEAARTRPGVIVEGQGTRKAAKKSKKVATKKPGARRTSAKKTASHA